MSAPSNFSSSLVCLRRRGGRSGDLLTEEGGSRSSVRPSVHFSSSHLCVIASNSLSLRALRRPVGKEWGKCPTFRQSKYEHPNGIRLHPSASYHLSILSLLLPHSRSSLAGLPDGRTDGHSLRHSHPSIIGPSLPPAAAAGAIREQKSDRSGEIERGIPIFHATLIPSILTFLHQIEQNMLNVNDYAYEWNSMPTWWYLSRTLRSATTSDYRDSR